VQEAYFFQKISVNNDKKMAEIQRFLTEMVLGIDVDVEHFVVAYQDFKIVACGALAGNMLKSVAVSESHQGNGLSTKLLTELVTLAYDLGRYNLFIYTKPENYQMFHAAGFYLLTSVKDKVILLENSRNRLRNYGKKLALKRKAGHKIGSMVINANPFTKGHQFLVEKASKECDWVHVFVVKEDRSFFSYHDRMNMILAGVAEFRNVIVHEGSDYMISRATFPSYFLKDEGVINYSHTAVDLQLFRQFIAPPLGITHRYVGTEPICKVTRFYNQQMHQWLTTPVLDSTPISLVEVPRQESGKEPISASLVRRLLVNNRWEDIQLIVPKTTYCYLTSLLNGDVSAYREKRDLVMQDHVPHKGIMA